MRPRQRFLAIGLAVAAAEAVLGAVLAGTALAAYFFGCAAATAAMAWGARRLLDPPRGDDGPGGGRGDDGPGGGRGDDGPRGGHGEDGPGGGHGGGPETPLWWPEFEAAFRRHVRDRDTPRV